MIETNDVKDQIPASQKPGKCRICGCTEKNPCITETDKPCGWANDTRTLCNNPICLRTAVNQAKKAKTKKCLAKHKKAVKKAKKHGH